MKAKIIKYVLESQLYNHTVGLLKRVKIKKADISLYTIVTIFIEKITKDEIIDKANGVAFNFTLAIFPAIIFLFTLTPYIQEFIPEVSNESIILFIGDIMPENMFVVVAATIEDIISKTRGGLLTFGALFSLFLATNGMLSLIKAFNACYKTVEKRGFFKTRMVATGLTIMLAFVLILAILLLVVGNIAIDFMKDNIAAIDFLKDIGLGNLDKYDYFLFLVLRFLVIFIVFFIAISFIYYFGPAVHYNWSFFSIGSIISTLLCIAVSYGFSFYITNFGTYNKVYGSIGVLIALMIWQMILSIVLLVGYEINAAIHQAHRQLPSEE